MGCGFSRTPRTPHVPFSEIIPTSSSDTSSTLSTTTTTTTTDLCDDSSVDDESRAGAVPSPEAQTVAVSIDQLAKSMSSSQDTITKKRDSFCTIDQNARITKWLDAIGKLTKRLNLEHLNSSRQVRLSRSALEQHCKNVNSILRRLSSSRRRESNEISLAEEYEYLVAIAAEMPLKHSASMELSVGSNRHKGATQGPKPLELEDEYPYFETG